MNVQSQISTYTTVDGTRVDKRRGETLGDLPAAFAGPNGDGAAALRRLVDAGRESEAGLGHVAENVQNRGTKLLLKAIAGRRAGFVRELLALLGEPVETATDTSAAGEVHRGLYDIATAMTIGRENQQQLALSDQLDLERKLLEAYAAALAAGLPAPAHAVVERQRNQVPLIYDRLEDLTESGDAHLVVRLFERGRDAEQAVEQLRAAGFSEQDVNVFEVEDLPVQRTTPAIQRKSQRSTIVAGAVSGGIVGALIGLAVALFQSQMPNLAPAISVDPLILFLASAFFGAAFGAIFGWIIGRNKVEDDTFVYQDSLMRGDKLVVVYADPARSAEAERILKIYHERELR